VVVVAAATAVAVVAGTAAVVAAAVTATDRIDWRKGLPGRPLRQAFGVSRLEAVD
jgi:hypothetical protein